MKFITQPPPGYRTYRLMLMALGIGTVLGLFGIYRAPNDLIGVAGVITAVLLTVTGPAAANNIGTRSKTNE